MAVKCIAIGNRIMGDDSVGIKVLEIISSQLEFNKMEVIYGETDIDYSLSQIENGDFIFILDSTYSNIEPGKVTFTPISKIKKVVKQQVYSQHQPNLLNEIMIYKKLIRGFVIGIEINEIDFSLELSDILNNKLSYICEEVCSFILNELKMEVI